MNDLASADRVVVIGGGISGLAAAHRLISSGKADSLAPESVTLIEGSSQLGGKVTTELTEGFLVEGGPDSFVTNKGAVLELTEELGISDRVISSRAEHRGAQIWSRGRLHPIPEGLLLMAPSRLSPLLRSTLFSVGGKLRIFADLVIPRRKPEGDVSLEEFVVRRFGCEMLDRLAEPLVAGIHAAEPAHMSLAASFPRFLEMEKAHRSLILAARAAARRQMEGAGPGLSYFASFREGMGELTGALVAALRGVRLVTGNAVTRLEGLGTPGTPGRFRLTLGDGSQVEAAGVILAIPAAETAALLSRIVPAVAPLVAGIRQVTTATVTLAYRRGDLTGLRGSGFVVPATERRRIMGVSYLSRKWEGRVDDGGTELLRAFVGGAAGQELAMAGEERLVAVVRSELAEILGVTATPMMTRAKTWVGGLHQYNVGHVERVAEVEAAIAAIPGLAVAGAAFHGIGLNECVKSGRRAADHIRSALSSTPSAFVGLDQRRSR